MFFKLSSSRYNTIKKEGDNLVFYATPQNFISAENSVLLGIGVLLLSLKASDYINSGPWLRATEGSELLGATILITLGLMDGSIEEKKPYVIFSAEGVETSAWNWNKKIAWDNVQEIVIIKSLLQSIIIHPKKYSADTHLLAYFLPISSKDFAHLLFQYKEEITPSKDSCLQI